MNNSCRKIFKLKLNQSKVLFIFIFLICFSYKSSDAQTKDSVKVNIHSPKKAALMSAVLPGLGQIYNKKYWKVPVLYAGVSAVTYFAVFNNKNYKKYKTAYKYRTDEDPLTIDDYDGKYTEQNLYDLKNFYRRNLELTVVCAVAVYALNIIDASVDAHLYDFEINNNLSLKIHPGLIYCDRQTIPSVGLHFNLK